MQKVAIKYAADELLELGPNPVLGECFPSEEPVGQRQAERILDFLDLPPLGLVYWGKEHRPEVGVLIEVIEEP